MASVPDYNGLLQQQQQADLNYLNQQTAANRPNQYNPWGSSTWQQNPDGTWANRVSLNPDNQQQLNQYNSLANTFLNGAKARSEWDLTGYSTQANQITPDAAIKALMDRMQPQLEASQNALQARLSAQGLTPGSQAYNNAYDVYNRQVNDANLGAIIQGTQYQGQQIDNLLKQYQLASTLKNQDLNSYLALQGGGQVQTPQFNSFTNAGAASSPDYASAAALGYNQQTGQNNANTAKMQGLLGGLGTLAGGYFGGSSGAASAGGALGGLIGGLF